MPPKPTADVSETLREGYVTVRGRTESVLVPGVLMNRAVDGDVVAVTVLPEAEWQIPTGWTTVPDRL